MTADSESERIAKAAKVAFEASQLLDPHERINSLRIIRQELAVRKDDIFKANHCDMDVGRLNYLQILCIYYDRYRQLRRK